MKELEMNPYVIQMDKFVKSLEKLSHVFLHLEDKHDEITEEIYQGMREDVKERVCKHCEKNETCKEKDHIRELIYTIEHYGAELNVEVKRRTQKKCMCATQYINAVLDTYKNEKQNIMWKQRIAENREGCAIQLGSFAKMIRHTTKELNASIFEDEHLEKKIKARFSKIGIKLLSTVFLVSQNGRYEIHVTIKAAKGEYISWLSHDDLYETNKVSHQVSLLNQGLFDPHNTIVSNRGGLIDGEGNALMHPSVAEKKYLNGLDFFKYLLFQKCVNGCGLLIPKSIFDSGLYFPENLRFVLDWNLWLKMAASGVGVYLDDAVLVKNRVHGGQVTVKQKQLHQTEAAQTIEEMFIFLQDKPVSYMKELYYSAYSTRKPNAPDIRRYLLDRGEKISGFKSVLMRVKIDIKKFAKRIYHAIR